MLKTLFIQTILAAHAIALTTAILIVVKPAPRLRAASQIPQGSLRPALSALVPGDRPQLSHVAP